MAGRDRHDGLAGACSIAPEVSSAIASEAFMSGPDPKDPKSPPATPASGRPRSEAMEAELAALEALLRPKRPERPAADQERTARDGGAT